MPAVVITQKAGATFGGSGKTYCISADASKAITNPSDYIRERPLPAGVNTVNQKPSFATYNGDGISRLYMVGAHTDNMVLTENMAMLRQGILPPDNPIVTGTGSGVSVGVAASTGTGITANAIYYLTFWDNVHQRRSPLSGGSPIQALVNKDVLGTNLPTTCADASVTHIEVWRSDDSATPRAVCRRTLGATGFHDTVPTLELGEAFDTDFLKFPRCRFNAIWHDRQAMAGDDRYPDRLYFSVLNQPERWSSFYLRTRKGEKIVALCVVRDSLVVFAARSCYVVTGYTEDDIQMNILEPDIGCISHHGIALIHGWAIIPTHLGFYFCTGSSMHWISQDFHHTWLNEYAANREAYESGWGANDLNEHVYKFYVGTTAASTIDSVFNGKFAYWVIDYADLTSQSTGNFSKPELSFDLKGRADTAVAMIALPGARRSDLWVGSADGHLRTEDSASDLDDGGDSFAKTAIIRTRHEYPNGPGGDDSDGSSFPAMWMYAQSEFAPYDINLYVGDERAIEALVPDFTETVPAGLKVVVVDELSGNEQYTMVPKTVHDTRPGREGRGITCEFRQASAPTTTRWYGWGCTVMPGRNARAIAAHVHLE